MPVCLQHQNGCDTDDSIVLAFHVYVIVLILLNLFYAVMRFRVPVSILYTTTMEFQNIKKSKITEKRVSINFLNENIVVCRYFCVFIPCIQRWQLTSQPH